MTADPVARDAMALINCEFRGDKAGADAILDQCDLRAVAKFFAGFGATALRQASGNAPNDRLVQGTGSLLLKMADDSWMPPSGEVGGARGFSATS
jgi:hypothetical protein